MIPSVLAKLFYGGAERIYSGTITYPSNCGIEQEKELEMGMLVPETESLEILKTR